MTDLGGEEELAAGRRFVEILAEVPRPAVVFAPLLQVAARHVEAYRVAQYMVVGTLGIDAAPASVKRHDELRLIVIIGRFCGIVHGAAARHERELALQEEEGGLAAIAAHFFLVLGVVASDAEDSAHGKLLV